jgi:predicted ATPase
MITRLEVDGFKSFKDFHVELRPFQVLIGANGAGKSNLFDVILLLSRLVEDKTLYDAVQQTRGGISELFTLLPDGSRAKTLRFAVEVLLEPTIRDDFGDEADLSANRLRYELHIERRREDLAERLIITHESLEAVTGDEDRWVKRNIAARLQSEWIKRGRRSPYISTDQNEKRINKHQDKRQGGLAQTPLYGERTVLSSITSADYPTAYAMRQAMLNWHFLQFDPVDLRRPVDVRDRGRLLPDGSNLAAVLYRMARDDEFALKHVSRAMAAAVPGINAIDVRVLDALEKFQIEATTTDGATFSSQVLSDGTLRLLAIIALANDMDQHGVICLEEPENGVHPERLANILDTLAGMATDFDALPSTANRIRQVVLNTHSPRLLQHVDPENMLYVYMAQGQRRFTRMSPITNDHVDNGTSGEIAYSRLSIEKFLDRPLPAQHAP